MGMTDTTWTVHCHITYRSPPVQYVHTVSLSKGLVYIFSANERKRLLLDICWAFSHDSFLFIIILWSTDETKFSFHRSFGQFFKWELKVFLNKVCTDQHWAPSILVWLPTRTISLYTWLHAVRQNHFFKSRQ